MKPRTVGELEEVLFEAFPLCDAEGWDNCGVAVGNRQTPLEKIAFNLDMSEEAVIAAHEAGCNVLVTHHPPFIKEGPTEFGPSGQVESPGPGRMVFEAIARGVNLIAMHTNADRAIATRESFAAKLGYSCAGNCEFVFGSGRKADETGLGALLERKEDALTLSELSSLCTREFGGSPRVWGDPERRISRIAFLNGSWRDSSLYSACIAEGVDCVIVGETGYHICVDAQPHLSIIELGHDRSELPIVDVLYDAIRAAGVDETDMVKLRCSDNNWWPAV